MDFRTLLFTFDGRISRKDFWIGTALLVVATIGLFFLSGFFGFLLAGGRGAAFLVGVSGLLLSPPTLAILLKRSNDRGYTPDYVLGLFSLNVAFQIAAMFGLSDQANPSLILVAVMTTILVVGLWTLIDLGCFRGTPGPNAFGRDPLNGA